MLQEMLQDRVDKTSSRLLELQRQADELDKKLSDANSLEEMAELARMLTEVRSDMTHLVMVRQKTMTQLDEDMARMQSPEYKAGIKKMSTIKADNEKKVKVIDEAMHHLLGLIDDLQDDCKQYDRLSRQHHQDGSPYGLFNKYGWISLLYKNLTSITHDLIYQTWSRR